MITTVFGDITKQDVDAVVNAARPSLLGGGGVDGAIHRAAGPTLFAVCSKIPVVPDKLVTDATRCVLAREAAMGYPPCDVRCCVGDARGTYGFRLPAGHVVHTVGPVYDPDDDEGGALLLESAYERSLLLAQMLGCRTVALPAISCGAYGYPLDKAARIAVGVAARPCWTFEEVRFVLFPENVKAAFDEALAAIS
jgi:O-acetyl-ADP-ribose deacetylase (regulator of RNase III)